MTLTVNPNIVKRIIKLGNMSSAEQRLWIGATGLLLRPTIDYYNKDVDEETRKYSAAKTAIKVAITVFDGVLTRYLAEKGGLILAKKGIIKPRIHNIPADKFARGVATALSFIATVVSTFTLDIPLINTFLNFTLDKVFPNKQKVAPKDKKSEAQKCR